MALKISCTLESLWEVLRKKYQCLGFTFGDFGLIGFEGVFGRAGCWCFWALFLIL